MPLTMFQCPDGQEIEIGKCLAQCRMGQRCVTMPTLYTILAGHREWSGRPSTTQLLNGTMLEWLRVKANYSTNPVENAYALLGTTHHAKLAEPQTSIDLQELQVATHQDDITGMVDLLTPDEEILGSYELVDYKTYGSYRVMNILGIQSRKERHPTEVYQRSGSWGKAGTPKTITTFYVDNNKIDRRQEELQLNHYRLKLESHGYQISKMNLQITVRDGGTQVAESRGIMKPLYYPVPIRRLPDQEVKDFFEPRAKKLIDHINNNTMPEPCNDEEAWDGRRCQDYCEVARFCTRGVRELALKANNTRRQP
jgi:hypothetical protein